MLRHLGIGPAHYMRLSRFVKALHMMPKAYSLTDIAYTVYYADQAHFCRDFKAIAGMTPQEILTENYQNDLPEMDTFGLIKQIHDPQEFYDLIKKYLKLFNCIKSIMI